MGGTNPKPTIPASTASRALGRTAKSDAISPRRRMFQNYLVIWVDGNIDEKNEDCRNTLAQLRAVVSDVNMCKTPQQCVEFLNEIDDGKAFIISSGALGRHLVANIHGMPTVDAIYIFCDNKERHELWSKDWSKIRGVFTSIKPICESLEKVAHECDHDSIPMSIVPKQIVEEGATGSDKNNLDRLPPSYMYSIIFKDIILEIDDDDEKSMNTLVKFCQKQNISETQVNEFKRGLLSFNNFLSTSMEPKVAMEFVERTMKKNPDAVGVIFIMTIDQSKLSTSNTPFAMIDEHSAVRGEKEILFTMHTVFRVVEMKQTAKNNRLWEVQLIITDDNDPQLSTLTNRIKEEVQGSTGWYRMGQLMLKVGHLDQAEELYQELLKNASSDSERAHIYHHLGYLKDQQGKYQEAVKFYEKALEIDRKTLPEDDASLAPTYSNIGEVYKNMGENSKALEYYEKSTKIFEISLPPNHPDLATSYNNIGSVYNNMGEYSKALEYYEKSLKIREISLPPTHPNLATSYNNIGLVYKSMGEYSKAFSYLEKALAIYRNSLPPTHHYIKEVMNDIDSVKKKL
ncbi:unnamed protein product [Rotaria magnacalcarata]|uniref:Kinesin light chain n=1 Tax=Rotaria magnacalcarata TaxID=392030 RepID=A0A814VWS7_9BILA|nr:unnamed protein product [Rotaria magnacalcarata]